MKANSLIEEQIACNHANTIEYYLDFNIIPAHMTIIVRQCNRLRLIYMILALMEARGLSRRYILPAAFTRISTNKLTCLSGAPLRSLESRIPEGFSMTL